MKRNKYTYRNDLNDIIRFSVEDCRNLGRGIRDCFSLKKFALTKSNLDQPRVAALLQEMTVNNSVSLDFR